MLLNTLKLKFPKKFINMITKKNQYIQLHIRMEQQIKKNFTETMNIYWILP